MKVSLMWKIEDGEGDAAVGPAWIDTYGDDGRVAHSEKAAGGEWISRRHARELAEANEWEYVEDAPDDTAPDDDPIGAIDVRALNRKLRKLGIVKDDLSVSSVGDTLFLHGLWVGRLPGVHPPVTAVGNITYRSSVISVTPTKLAEALDLLAPAWRDDK